MKVRVLPLLLTMAVVAGMAAWWAKATPTQQPDAPGVNYHVETVNSREVIIVCTNGAQPLLAQSTSLPTVVSIKCMDIAANAAK